MILLPGTSMRLRPNAGTSASRTASVDPTVAYRRLLASSVPNCMLAQTEKEGAGGSEVGSANGPARSASFDLIEVITMRMIGPSQTAASANIIIVAVTFGAARSANASAVGDAVL